MCLKRLHHFWRCCEIWNNEELSYLDVKKCYPTTLSISLHREPYIPVFCFISYLTDHQIQTVKGNILRGVLGYERMMSWAMFTQNSVLLYSETVIWKCSAKKIFLKFSRNSQENTGAVYCPFLFIENLTLTSSISFPVNMERSKRTTNRIGHLSL